MILLIYHIGKRKIMKETDDYLRETSAMDHDELVAYAKKAAAHLADSFRSEQFADHQANSIVLAIVCCTFDADREFNDNEKQFFKDVFGFDGLNALLGVKSLGSKIYRRFVPSLAGMDDKTKEKMCTLVSAAAAIDGTVSGDEIAFLREIIDA